MRAPLIRTTTVTTTTTMLLTIGGGDAVARMSVSASAALAAASGRPVTNPVPAGKPGLGDPYFPAAGNGGYDVRHYDVALAYRPKGRRVEATVTITAQATQNLSAFSLDYRGPRITKVRVQGAPARYVRKGQELVITPARALARERTFTVVVCYSGKPKTAHTPALGSYGWVNAKDGALVVAEPDGAPTWLPVNDHPADKATYSFRIAVPKALQAVANGEPEAPIRSGDTITYVWTERSPMASYLATVAIGRFNMRRGMAGRVPVITAVDKRFGKSAAALQRTTAKVLAWESKLFGPYPFATTGGIVDDPELDYALETQERPVYAGFAPDEDFIVHELAHQWFGNSVSLRNWRDIWLNEGFATYAEWLWHERGGQDSAKKIFKRYYRQSGGSAVFDPPPGRPGRKNLFAFSVYVRGAMCLQALRDRVGRKVFFKILRTWATERRHGNGSTPEFIALAERLSGRQLDRLFKAWLYKKGKPKSW